MSPGDKDGKWPREWNGVVDEMLILWLKMDRKMDVRSSRNGVWKFGKKDYI
jgi:hypothetical protein